jgi:hypothetical protein
VIREAIDFGVCRLSVVSLRSGPSHKSEQVSQLLFGDHYEVLETNKDKQWLRIVMYYDQCEGWISARQHHGISREYYDYINRADFKITTDLSTSILYNKSPLLILIGSIIPISGSELFRMEEQFAFNGDAKSLGQKRDFEFLKATVYKYINAPFQWGGRNPFGIDGPGFVQVSYKINGYRLGRTVQEQMRQGREISHIDDVLPGDLVFFQSIPERLPHVGVVLDHDRVIHAWEKVRVDHFEEGGLLNPETKIFTHQLTTLPRIMTG